MTTQSPSNPSLRILAFCLEMLRVQTLHRLRPAYYILFLAAALGAVAAPASAQLIDPATTLWSQSTLYRDAWGVPHIYADNTRALAFAFGYAQAEDHLEPMLLAYRIANGRAAEVLGQHYATSDAFALKMSHARLARDAFQTVDPETRALCEGFAAGVNAWMLDYPSTVPNWAQGVQDWDVLALWHAFIMSMAPFDLPGVYRPTPALESANAWALAPNRTTDGKTILVINPHQYYDGPFSWYEAHLVMEGLNVTGATLFGLPIILQGHNEVLGWALTPNAPDFADMFHDQIKAPPRNPNNPSLPQPDLMMRPMMNYASQSQTYYVQTAQGMVPQTVITALSPSGPIFEGVSPNVYTWHIAGFGDFNGLSQLLQMGRAQSKQDFQRALALWHLPCFNILYADQEGNISYLYNAKVPDRSNVGYANADPNTGQITGYNWRAPLPAFIESQVWSTVVPLDALPRIENPDAGYLQASGSPPWFATTNAPLTPQDWPNWLVGDDDTYRARRVRQLLATGQRSFLDNQSMLYDVLIPFAIDVVPQILAMADQQAYRIDASHPDLANGLDLLRDWIFFADTTSSAMTFFDAWKSMIYTTPGLEGWTDDALYQSIDRGGPDVQEFVLEAATNAARMMRNTYQEINVPWGDVHRIQRGNRDEALPGAGAGNSIFTLGASATTGVQAYANYGYGFAMAVEFGDTPQSVSVVPFGASEQPDSPHYDDQLDLFVGKQFKKTRFQEDDVLRYAQQARGIRFSLQPMDIEGTLAFDSDVPIGIAVITQEESPYPYPPGIAAFTPFIILERTGMPGLMDVQIRIKIPDALCDNEHLSQLALYAYNSDDIGWQLVPRQQLDTQERLFTALHEGAAVYAVLGPEFEKPDEAAAENEDEEQLPVNENEGNDP